MFGCHRTSLRDSAASSSSSSGGVSATGDSATGGKHGRCGQSVPRQIPPSERKRGNFRRSRFVGDDTGFGTAPATPENGDSKVVAVGDFAGVLGMRGWIRRGDR